MPTDKRLHAFKNQLLARQKDLLKYQKSGEKAADIVVLDQTSVGRLSRMDAMQGQAMQIQRENVRKLDLQKIATALDRINSGEYGFCLRCSDDIAIERLEFDPAITLCIRCASG